MNTVIHTHHLTRRFGDFTAVDHLNLDVSRSQIIGYLGPNGSGKTTTIRMLLGMLQPSEGEAQVLGYDIVTQAEAIRSQCGYMSQKFSLYYELSARENLEFFAGVYGVQDKQRIKDVMHMLELDEIQNQRVDQLSTGWRQRLSLATAIVHKPGLLFLDEPTSGVDPVARRAFWNIIYELASNQITVMVTTHYMDEAEYCSVVGIMRAGKLMALDEPEHLRNQLPGVVYEVHTDHLFEALNALEKYPQQLHTSHAGDHIRLIAVPDCRLEDIRDYLQAEGIASLHIQPGIASMEDVFMLI